MELYRAKNVDTRIVFPITKADGTLVSGAAGLDSEYASFNTADHGGSAPSFADCTHEAVEIGSTGFYYLDVQGSEINSDFTAIQVKSSTSGALVQGILIRTTSVLENVNVVNWSGTAVATPATAGYPVVTNKVGSGTGELDLTSGVIKANLVQILATALTETAGYLAAGFKAFFNVASPVHTVASVNQTGDSFAVVKSGGTGDNAAIKAKTDNLPASPAATGAKMDLVDAPNATAITAFVSAINTLATYGLTALNTLLVTTGIKAATIPAVTNATLSSAYDAAKTAAPTAASIADAVCDEALSGHEGAGTVGAALNTQIVKMVESSDGTTVTLYKSDGTTPLGTFSWSESTKTRGRLA